MDNEKASIVDLRRELNKAIETLTMAKRHLARLSEMNAALHCSDQVMYSPLYAKVEATIYSLNHALSRNEHPGLAE